MAQLRWAGVTVKFCNPITACFRLANRLDKPHPMRESAL